MYILSICIHKFTSNISFFQKPPQWTHVFPQWISSPWLRIGHTPSVASAPYGNEHLKEGLTGEWGWLPGWGDTFCLCFFVNKGFLCLEIFLGGGWVDILMLFNNLKIFVQQILLWQSIILRAPQGLRYHQLPRGTLPKTNIAPEKRPPQ